MRELLRKKDVVDAVGTAKSTVADWISEYAIYIPTIKQGNVTYYKPEAIDILTTIKELREQNLPKAEIALKLASNFAINVDIGEKEITEFSAKTDVVIAAMATMSKAIEQMGRQDDEIKELRDEVAASREETEKLKAQVQAIQEEKSRGFWSKLFGGK